MLIPLQYKIQDKQVLSKVANMMFIANEINEQTNIVSIHANIYKLELPPVGQTEIPAIKINVFFDDFYVNQADLPGEGTLEEKVLAYVCNIWGVTVI